MVFSSSLAATVIFLIFFASIPKKLHLFELMFCYMAAIYLYGSIAAIIILNFNTIQLNPDLYHIWSFVCTRFVLVPLIMVWLMALYATFSSVWIKSVLTLSFLAAFIGIEYATEWLDIITHVNWQFWWSIVFWSSQILAIRLLWGWYRNIFRKEMKRG
jgi:hypothetical protein